MRDKLRTDPRVDAYVAKAADLAKVILTHIRKLMHDATREKRIVRAVEWLAEGKDRNWKYR